MAWFHTFNKKVSSGNAADIEKAFHEMTETLPKAPKLMRVSHFYSKKYYNTRLKAVIHTEWDAIKDNIPKPSRITTINTITERMYAEESQSFKDQLEVERQEDHTKELEEYQQALEHVQRAADSAQTYHQ